MESRNSQNSPSYLHSFSRYEFIDDRYQPHTENVVLEVEKVVAPIGPVRPMAGADNYPKEYDYYARNILLLNGDVVSAYYNIAKDRIPPTHGCEQSREAIIAAFIWVLETSAFQRGELTSEGRGIEIGNIISIAIAYGLSEEQVVRCYNTAYAQAKTSI